MGPDGRLRRNAFYFMFWILAWHTLDFGVKFAQLEAKPHRPQSDHHKKHWKQNSSTTFLINRILVDL